MRAWGLQWRLRLSHGWRAGYCCVVSSLSYIKQTFHNSLVLSNCILPGGRLDPSRVRIVDVFDTHNDPFASNIRQGLRKAGIDGSRGSSSSSSGSVVSTGSSASSKAAGECSNMSTGNDGSSKAAYDRGSIVAVWSDEPVARSSLALTEQRYKKSYYGTISYIPA